MLSYRPLHSVLALVAASLAVGCSPPPPVPSPAPINPADYQTTFDAAARVLRDARFTVDRRDARFGQLTTEPKGSPTLFEPWVGDNVTTRQAAAATLGNLRRTVRVTLTPPPPGMHRQDISAVATTQPDHAATPPRYDLAVEVLLERYQSPARRMSGATKGAVFYNLDANPAELAARGITPAYWEPVGRDPDLEARLLRRIVREARAAP